MSEPGGDLARDYFALFGLAPTFALDQEALTLRYRDLQRAVHPDRFAGAGDRERREAVQRASHVNEAYRVLRLPLARARYLLELKGVAFDETDTAMDPAFLMEQMELREALAEVRDAADPFTALNRARVDIEQRERVLHEELQAQFDRDTPEARLQARNSVRKLQFLDRLLEEAARLEEELIHGLE